MRTTAERLRELPNGRWRVGINGAAVVVGEIIDVQEEPYGKMIPMVVEAVLYGRNAVARPLDRD